MNEQEKQLLALQHLSFAVTRERNIFIVKNEHLQEENSQLKFRVERLKGIVKRQANIITKLERSRLALRSENIRLRHTVEEDD